MEPAPWFSSGLPRRREEGRRKAGGPRITDHGMFDLEKAIVAWRRSFRYRRVFFEDDLEELERHLRDHVAGRVEQG